MCVVYFEVIETNKVDFTSTFPVGARALSPLLHQEEANLREGGEKKWAGKFGRVDTNLCGVASQPLPGRWFGASAPTVRSAQRRGEDSGQRDPPPGREGLLLLFHVDLSPVDMSCF